MTTIDTIVLAGQSTNAIVTLGALQYLYDVGRISSASIVRYVGTSSGAIISAMLAIGYTPLDLLVYTCTERPYRKLSTMNIANLLLMRKSLTTIRPLSDAMTQLIVDKVGYVPTLKQLYDRFNIELVCVTYDLTSDATKYLSYRTDDGSTMSIVDAAMMSSSFPFVFEPLLHSTDNHHYIDGAITDNFATDYVIDRCAPQNCVGIVITQAAVPYVGDASLSLQLIMHLLHVFIDAQMMHKIKRARSVGMNVYHLKRSCDFFNFNDDVATLLEMFDNGYEQVKTTNLSS